MIILTAKFDIRDIRGGFDTGQLFANNKNNLEHKTKRPYLDLVDDENISVRYHKIIYRPAIRQSLAKKMVEGNTGPIGERFTLFCSRTIKSLLHISCLLPQA